jgi:NAD(P)-dependent dehydrogenase (short-subunit alcohol dehydrogenase family)
VNARGVFLGMKYAVTQMMKQDPLASGKRGWIVNIASIGGQVGLALESTYQISTSNHSSSEGIAVPEIFVLN